MDDLVGKHFERERERIAKEARVRIGAIGPRMAARGTYHGGGHVGLVFQEHANTCEMTAHALVEAYKRVATDTGSAPNKIVIDEAKTELAIAVDRMIPRIRQRMLELCHRIKAGKQMEDEVIKWLDILRAKTLASAQRELEIWLETEERKSAQAPKSLATPYPQSKEADVVSSGVGPKFGLGWWAAIFAIVAGIIAVVAYIYPRGAAETNNFSPKGSNSPVIIGDGAKVLYGTDVETIKQEFQKAEQRRQFLARGGYSLPYVTPGEDWEGGDMIKFRIRLWGLDEWTNNIDKIWCRKPEAPDAVLSSYDGEIGIFKKGDEKVFRNGAFSLSRLQKEWGFKNEIVLNCSFRHLGDNAGGTSETLRIYKSGAKWKFRGEAWNKAGWKWRGESGKQDSLVEGDRGP